MRADAKPFVPSSSIGNSSPCNYPKTTGTATNVAVSVTPTAAKSSKFKLGDSFQQSCSQGSRVSDLTSHPPPQPRGPTPRDSHHCLDGHSPINQQGKWQQKQRRRCGRQDSRRNHYPNLSHGTAVGDEIETKNKVQNGSKEAYEKISIDARNLTRNEARTNRRNRRNYKPKNKSGGEGQNINQKKKSILQGNYSDFDENVMQNTKVESHDEGQHFANKLHQHLENQQLSSRRRRAKNKMTTHQNCGNQQQCPDATSNSNQVNHPPQNSNLDPDQKQKCNRRSRANQHWRDRRRSRNTRNATKASFQESDSNRMNTEPTSNEFVSDQALENVPKDARWVVNEESFPSLDKNPPSNDHNTRDELNAHPQINGPCWASKLATSLESVQQNDEERGHRKTDEQQVHPLLQSSSMQLTMLSSRASSIPNSVASQIGKNVDCNNTKARNAGDDDDSDDCGNAFSNHVEPQSQKETPPTSADASEENELKNINPSIMMSSKQKWNDVQISRMRKRWWEIMRSKRMKEEEVRKAKAASDETNVPAGEQSDEESVASTSSCSSSTFSSSVASLEDDDMQPPSLSIPFDETPRRIKSASNSSGSTTPPTKQLPSKSVLDLEEKCLQSDHPLHCAIFQCAKNTSEHQNSLGRINVSIQSDAEAVLFRLLSTRSPSETCNWKSQRVSLDELKKESNILPLDHNTRMSLLSADVQQLTPLQFATYLNLPRMVRILQTATSSDESGTNSIDGDKYCINKSSKNKNGEEDDHVRTPLMLACELKHTACIEALLCTSKLKLDHRERKGGNTAFHFCCVGNSLVRRANSDDDSIDKHDENTSSDCTAALDLLLEYTPKGIQKRAFLLPNREGDTLMHMACARGDLCLVESLLDHLGGLGQNLVWKALNAKNSLGHVPFVTAVVADSREVVMHLLVTRSTAGANFSSWFSACPLAIAASNNSVEMVTLLLEVGYDSALARHSQSSSGGLAGPYDMNRALLETIRRNSCGNLEKYSRHDTSTKCEFGIRSDTLEIINVLISHGANPHSSVSALQSKTNNAKNDDNQLGATMRNEDVPLSAAARAGDVELLKCMMDAYSIASKSMQSLRRNDPLLSSQPDSYFRVLEQREDDVAHSSIQAALVKSLFLVWKGSSYESTGGCSIAIYKRNVVLSQSGMLWLERSVAMNALTPPPLATNDFVEGIYFEAPFAQFGIRRGIAERKTKLTPCYDTFSHFMGWSYVMMAKLDWFQPIRNVVSCSWMRTVTQSDCECHLEHAHLLPKDEFYLVAENQKLLAHKSIVSAKCGKLAAAIHFMQSQACDSYNDLLMVKVDLPSSIAKMLLCHCYHGSMAFGLLSSPIKQCHQILEMALVAEEYLCPTLLLECEMRLLMQPASSYNVSEMSDIGACMCSNCSGAPVCANEQTMSTLDRECLKMSFQAEETSLCQPIGVGAYRASNFIASSETCLITPDSALNVLAVAQQLEQSSSSEYGFYAIKHCKFGGIDQNSTMAIPSFGGWNIDLDDCSNSGVVCSPFSAAKTIAIRVMLRDFAAVLKSQAYLQNCSGEKDDFIDPSLSMDKESQEEDAVLLLKTCLEELACNPLCSKLSNFNLSKKEKMSQC